MAKKKEELDTVTNVTEENKDDLMLAAEEPLQVVSTMKSKHWNWIQGYIFISPWLIGLLIFGIYPIFQSLRMAFSQGAGYEIQNGERVFVIDPFGFDQFKQIFQDNPDIVESLISFTQQMLLIVPLVLIFALIIALMLNQEIKFRAVFRMIFFMPVILLSGNMLQYFGQYGLMDIPVLTNGEIIETISFYFTGSLGEIIQSVFSMIVLILWLSGVQTLVFLAGLTKIDRSIYEAASIDGANTWDAFWKITLPTLLPLLIVNIVYTTVVYLNLSSNEIMEVINSANTDIDLGRDFTSALSWVVFLIGLLVIGVYSLVIRLGMKRYE